MSRPVFTFTSLVPSSSSFSSSFSTTSSSVFENSFFIIFYFLFEERNNDFWIEAWLTRKTHQIAKYLWFCRAEQFNGKLILVFYAFTVRVFFSSLLFNPVWNTKNCRICGLRHTELLCLIHKIEINCLWKMGILVMSHMCFNRQWTIFHSTLEKNLQIQ